MNSLAPNTSSWDGESLQNLPWTECDSNSPYRDRVDGPVVRVSRSAWINCCFLLGNWDRVWFRPPRHRVWEALASFHGNRSLIADKRQEEEKEERIKARTLIRLKLKIKLTQNFTTHTQIVSLRWNEPVPCQPRTLIILLWLINN